MLVLWGIIISVTLYPLFKKLSKKLGGREKLAARFDFWDTLNIF